MKDMYNINVELTQYIDIIKIYIELVYTAPYTFFRTFVKPREHMNPFFNIHNIAFFLPPWNNCFCN